MREIKFRAWDKYFKKMLYTDFMSIHSLGIESSWNEKGGSGDKEDYELMQYTGLKDKNGKEIYESDLVVWDDGHYEVVFSVNEGSWILKDDREDWDCPSLYGIRSEKQSRIEVVGNCFETPELLSKAK